MKAVRRTGTEAELRLRRELHGRGLRYRVDIRPDPATRSRADIVFTRARLAIFVDGCFWHRCPIHGTAPRANSKWWAAKIDGNVDRDRRTDAHLEALGWHVVRVWEHEDPHAAADRIEQLLRATPSR